MLRFRNLDPDITPYQAMGIIIGAKPCRSISQSRGRLARFPHQDDLTAPAEILKSFWPIAKFEAWQSVSTSTMGEGKGIRWSAVGKSAVWESWADRLGWAFGRRPRRGHSCCSSGTTLQHCQHGGFHLGRAHGCFSCTARPKVGRPGRAIRKQQSSSSLGIGKAALPWL